MIRPHFVSQIKSILGEPIMNRTAATLSVVVLSFGLALPVAFSQQAPTPPKQNFQAGKPASQQDVPAELQAAMDKLASARNDLEHAGGDWGGYRQQAINHIQEAESNLKKAREWKQTHK
jgi:hypothetical protein